MGQLKYLSCEYIFRYLPGRQSHLAAYETLANHFNYGPITNARFRCVQAATNGISGYFSLLYLMNNCEKVLCDNRGVKY